MKRRLYWSVLLGLFLILMMSVPTLAAEGKMNVAALCLTDDGKSSAQNMEKLLKENKMPFWRLNKLVPYYSDEDKRPTTKASIDKILDSAFGSSTSQDVNYLFIASHGFAGTNKADTIAYYQTGLILNERKDPSEGVYKFTDLAKKLVSYKGKFVVILDSCFAQNFYTRALSEDYPGELSRFSVMCSAKENSYAYGIGYTQFYTAKHVNALTYKSSLKRTPADVNKNGFITMQELYDAVGKSLVGYFKYGNGKTDLFQFGYVKLSKSSATINMADKNTLSLGSYAKKYKCTSKQSIKWKTSNSSIASVDKKGKVTAKKEGTVTITAYIADAKGNMCLGSEAKCTVKVVEPKITLNKTAVTLYKDETDKLIATVTGTKKKVTWKSSKSSVASVKNGKITAKKPGTATIIAKVGKISAQCKVTVKKPTLTLNPSSKTIEQGSGFTIKAIVGGKSKAVKWSSSNKNIATVSGGYVRGNEIGAVTITASANGVTAKCRVTVKKKSETPQMNKTELKLNVGYGDDLYVILGGKKYVSTPEWTTSNPQVAYFDENHGRIRVTGIHPGTATITAVMNGKKCTCKVIVTEVKKRMEVSSFIGKDIWTAAEMTGAGSVGTFSKYGMIDQGYDHACDAAAGLSAMSKYYTGINDYKNEEAYKAARFDIRMEAYDTGKINMIEMNGQDTFAVEGVFLGMDPYDADNMLAAHGYEWKSYGGIRDHYSSLTGDYDGIDITMSNGKVAKIMRYNAEFTFWDT